MSRPDDARPTQAGRAEGEACRHATQPTAEPALVGRRGSSPTRWTSLLSHTTPDGRLVTGRLSRRRVRFPTARVEYSQPTDSSLQI